MDCEQLLAALNDYVDGHVDPAICKTLERHMADCNPCQVVVDNIRHTIHLYKATGEAVELPPELQRRLNSALRECWEKKFSKPPAQG